MGTHSWVSKDECNSPMQELPFECAIHLYLLALSNLFCLKSLKATFPAYPAQ